MQRILARRARTAEGWQADVAVTLEDGQITAVQDGQSHESGDVQVDVLLPALGNLHSHTFQRAMAGMTEHRAAGQDSFWTWRSLMYRFVDQLTPEDYEAIAALTFMEMMEAGYAAVGEFHYVHHTPGGTPYARLTELSDRVFAAAAETGIGLTHLPVLYSCGGAGEQPLAGGQLRFGNDIERFATLVTQARAHAARALPSDARVGVAPHSLRAICPADLAEAVTLAEDNPIHIHIAEQPREVEEISTWLGARPVDWLLANAEVDAQWCLIHATHMTEAETVAMARSGAVAGLCPITEANLGDGPFNGPLYLQNGGAFGVGSDSNVRIALGEELRTLEYSQRLHHLQRNVMIAGEGSVGAALYLGAASGGARALGRNSGRIVPGALADLVAIDASGPALCTLDGDAVLDGLCFSAPDRIVTDMWSAGRHRVRSGRHVEHDQIVQTYQTRLQALLSRI
ncbi:formimidoylglutamate deiminase [Ruegeria sp. WL0004]|uniref:Formimidoylglutamate deiminase n=1 Tax=Ruegeria marisflavi TaxID=2984152 RepID=A0ABT2WWI0_9RHOB|nr:formimidoylglutamate deiminase [Ruegeria sp. WL0004]MCU9840023.1 formimidoylglutamate deiminase [Ruegeria sp. WL0004]